ncbi:MAG TPA: aromatic amino acid ammonia-lyase [Bacteroidia bacterium]|nr:aromatic amino acid ammonia-lyase [Bacteroidia bacterium]
MSTIKIGAEKLTLSTCKQILIDNQVIEIDDAALQRVYESHYFLKEFIKDKLIYGVNTGFGPMAQYKISHDDQIQLQYNLIRSHCSGSGNPIAEINVRATMLARLNMLLLGYSGIHPEAVILLKEMINRHITPIIFEHGGLGASGDLVQLAHLALTMIGEGDVQYKGEIIPTEKAFKVEKLTPLSIHIREGLALMNGTSAMCGMGIINLLHAKNILDKATQASAMIIEMVESYDDHYSNELNSVKLHRGQNHIAHNIRTHLADSKLVKKRGKHLYDQPTTETIVKEKVQEYYSIRCVPQILGPVYDTITFAEEIIIDEINSANDNPIVDYKNKNVFHGGNFHGDYPAIEMDKLKIAITKLSMLSERQLNFLMNDKLNGKLPPFVNLGTLGLNLGMQGTQFTATSTVAENQTLSNPMYIHSIPSNNDNQDIVSMGSNAALMAQKVINNTYEVLAIEFISIIQAIDYLKCESKLSTVSKKLYADLRAIVPSFDKDTIQYVRQQKIIAYLKKS